MYSGGFSEESVGGALRGRHDDAAGATTTPSADVLDRIDHIVAPNVTVTPADDSYGDQELLADQRRR